MTPIKFRAWDKATKRLFVLGDGHDTFMFFSTGASYYNLQNGSGGEEYDLMQFTGLIDKNGKEIYEGDIVVNGLSGTWIVQPLEGGSFGLLGVCEKYKDSNFLISALNDHAEVIGNIYEKAESI